MTPRSEPLLWVQLISLGAIPLELLLLLLLLAGSDPGPLPQLERLLAWALGALAPALLLWRQPADPRSLLLISAASPPEPELAVSLAQRQRQSLPRLLFAAGVVALLPLLSWLDAHAALASNFSPLPGGNRLSALLWSVALLALMVWQWQQLVQAIWLLISPEATSGDGGSAALRSSTRLGLPLLALPALQLEAPVRPKAQQSLAQTQDERTDQPAAAQDEPEQQAEPQSEPQLASESEPSPPAEPGPSAEPETDVEPEPEALEEISAESVAIEPEQAAEDSESTDLDQQVGADDLTPGS